MSKVTHPAEYGFTTPEEQLAYREGADMGRDAAALLVGQLLGETHFRATHSKLTGLLNQEGLDEALSFLPTDPDEKSYVVVGADIKNLKLVNDKLGHAGGDAAIRDVGEAFALAFRKHDIVAHPHGDEFIAVAHTGYQGNNHRHGDLSPHEQAKAIGLRIGEVVRGVVSKYNALLGISTDSDEPRFDFSAGFSVWTPEEQSFEQAAAAADAAMYAHKESQGAGHRPSDLAKED
jgi:diguanylate cyclase (GGDEF)-like protein